MHYYLIGSSGHASVIIDIFKTEGLEISGLFDDFTTGIKSGIPIIGKSDAALNYEQDSQFIIAVGDNTGRKKLADKLYMLKYKTIIHKSAIIGSNVVVDCGTVIFPKTVINAGTVIGKHAIVNTGAIVEHNCCIGDCVHISPGATLCGDVTVGDNSWVGAGSTVIPKVKIGSNVIVGAGTTVIRDVPDGTTVVGNPARELKRITESV